MIYVTCVSDRIYIHILKWYLLCKYLYTHLEIVFDLYSIHIHIIKVICVVLTLPLKLHCKLYRACRDTIHL